MNVLDRIPSAWRWLTAQERAVWAPTASEAAMRRIALRMGVKL